MKEILRKFRLTVSALLPAVALALSALNSWPAHGDVASGTTTNSPKSIKPVTAGPADGSIAFWTAAMLHQIHFLHYPLDDKLSEKFFDRYLEMLDPQRMHFTQEDIAEFQRYRTLLDDLTVNRKRVGDTTPAYEIFNRFLERFAQRVDYAAELLKANKFDFSTDERMLTNRREEPYPKNLAEAKELWKQRLRFEYLQEKLGRSDAKKAGKKPHEDRLPDPKKEDKTAKKKTDAEEVSDLLSRRYQRMLRMFTDWDNTEVLEKYLTSLAHVYDPHSDFMNENAAKNFAISMNLALFGIGAVLTTDLDGYCQIQELKPGPAMKSKKMKAGDRIVAVAQGDAPPVDVVEMSLQKAVQLIRGPKGTEVRLTIIPVDSPSERRVVSLIRDEIKLEDQEVKAKVIEMPAPADKPLRLGIIDLPTFYASLDRTVELASEDGAGTTRPAPRSTSFDVAKILKKFKDEKVGGVILDLRRNGGGSLEEAIKLTGLFIKTGPVVQVRTSGNNRTLLREDNDPSVLYEGPLMVLTSRFSASASEIVAGALQDYGRAIVVGDISTHGKGTVQNLNPLAPYVEPANPTNDPGELKVTIQKFYRASGASTQLKGVMPDIVLPSVLNFSKDIGEDALENPLPWDTIASAKYDKLDLVTPCLADLLKRSNQRVATNRDFAYIREDIELFRKNQADKTISLNEQERRKEKEEMDARQKARESERRTRKEPEKKTYELTLKLVELPGLPPPVAKTNGVLKAEGSVKWEPTGTNSTGIANVPNALSNSLARVIETNTATTTITSAAVPEFGEEAEEPLPAFDATLEEAERILMDYISLLSQKNLVSAHP